MGLQNRLDPTTPIIARYMEDAPVDVHAIARDLGLKVLNSSAMDDDTAGMIIKDDKASPSGFVIHLRAQDSARRRRFTLAHELGHFVLHKSIIGDGLIDSAMYRSRLGDMYERQANRWAADTLMPAGVVRAYYRGGTHSVQDLARILDVSEAAVKIRLEELHLTPEG